MLGAKVATALREGTFAFPVRLPRGASIPLRGFSPTAGTLPLAGPSLATQARLRSSQYPTIRGRARGLFGAEIVICN